MYQVVFAVRCTTCCQMLEPAPTDEGVAYTHGNVDDCSEIGVTLPFVSTEDLAALATHKKAVPMHAAPAEKVAPKKKGK